MAATHDCDFFEYEHEISDSLGNFEEFGRA